MINFKLIYFDKQGIDKVSLIENAHCLPVIGGKIVVYVNELQEVGMVSDIVYFFKGSSSEIIVYAESKSRIENAKRSIKKISEIGMSPRLFKSLRFYYHQRFESCGDFGSLPMTELFKINAEEMSKSRMVGTKTISEFKEILSQYNMLRTIDNPYL